MKESERYSLALELGGGKKTPKKNRLDSVSFPGKNKQDFIKESTSHCVPMWQLEATVKRELR